MCYGHDEKFEKTNNGKKELPKSERLEKKKITSTWEYQKRTQSKKD